MQEPLVYMKVFEVNGEKLVAICDEEVLGARLKEDKITLYVDPNFYGERLVPLSVALEEAKTATLLNLVGENIVNAAVREGLVHPQAILRVQGVPHAQVIRMTW
ncbi:hypothetical protein Pyrfu_1958 [Pyrolobus fumarii 1A]|uniref:DUF424 domain-containing protein n=1 Tax=Pyrolobus fumarii (strain DSM 11204 / 1A) TaxID=694429 RepID=G0EDK7_PYRF1|nr:DUF424 family protein [Pyrolobus fumarii]AEM39811.1 hypothetical protein Pyrfu_1958 [Pyrolobus fumarii 1A]